MKHDAEILKQLSVGALKDINMSVNSRSEVVVQVIGIKRILGSYKCTDTKRSERYCLVISDSRFYCQIEKFALIRVCDYMTDTVGNRKLLVICRLEPVGQALPNLIGNPLNLEEEPKADCAKSTRKVPPSISTAVLKPKSIGKAQSMHLKLLLAQNKIKALKKEKEELLSRNDELSKQNAVLRQVKTGNI